MGFFNTLWSVVSKPIAIAGNAVGKSVGVDGLGDAIVGGVQVDRAESLQQQAINKQTAATEYAANMAYKGAHEANELNYAATTQANAANRAIARETNLMNYAINQENNAANLALAREQNMWQEQQIAKQNAYNSPAHQVDLYRAAGLNPAALAGGNTWTPSGYASSANLANQQAAQMQQASPMQAPQFSNEYADSANIMMQGALQESNIRKDLLKNSAETNLLKEQARNIYFQTHRGEVLLPSELNKLNSENDKILTETANIHYLSPSIKENLLKQNFVLTHQGNYLIQQAKTEKEKREFQILLNKAQKVNNSILESTQDDLKKMPRAQLKSLLAQGFAAMARGNYDNFVREYEKLHQHSIPRDGAMMLLSLFSQDKEFMDKVKHLVTSGGSSIVNHVENITGGADKLADGLMRIIEEPGDAFLHFVWNFDPFGIFGDSSWAEWIDKK